MKCKGEEWSGSISLTMQCLSDTNHPIKLPGLLWDGNGEEFALHSHAPWHVLPSRGEEPDDDQFADDLWC